MLVLARREGEKVTVTATHAIQPGDRLEIEVTQMESGQVKLGFTGPRAFVVFRTEIQVRRDAGEVKP